MLRQTNKIIKGLGTVLGQQVDPRKELERTLRRIYGGVDAYEFVKSPGWDKVCAGYRHYIAEMWDRIRHLTLYTDRNAEEIQRRRNLIVACEMWLEISDDIIADYEQSVKEHAEQLETAQKTRLAS